MPFVRALPLLALLMLPACGSEGPEQEGDGPPSAPTPELSEGTTELEQRTDEEQSSPERVAVRHILLEFTSEGERKEAVDLARSLREKILQGEDMSLLAKKHSKDGTAPRGGFLGAAERGAWVEPFEKAAFSLAVGELSEPVETEYGIHLLRREALTEVKLMHLLVAHKEAKNVARERSPVGKRTREQALEMAQAALEKLEEGVDFAAVASEFSDTPMAQRGAELGWFVRGELGPDFDRVAFALEPEEHSEVFETVFGFHIIRRLE